jgi:hypothetical protein
MACAKRILGALQEQDGSGKVEFEEWRRGKSGGLPCTSPALPIFHDPELAKARPIVQDYRTLLSPDT